MKNTFLAILILISIAGCNSELKKEVKPEVSVFYEIFPKLIDSFHFDSRLTFYEINNDTLKLDSLSRDTTSIFIAIRDTLQNLETNDYESLQNHLKELSEVVDSLNEDTLRIIDFGKLRTNDKRIKFRTISSFPTGLEFWQTDYPFYLSAKFYFSNILFNKEKTRGLLHVGYVCGPYQCGEGFLVFIEKIRDKWVIEKYVGTWAM